MNIEQLPAEQLRRLLRTDGFDLQIGPFRSRVTSSIEQVATGMRFLYGDHQLLDPSPFADSHIHICHASGLARLRGEPTRMLVDGQEWYRAPRPLGFACLEWALNWFIFRRAHHQLIIHAANLERDGVCLMLPAESGCGKSTLCAALAHSGWRLFSDELAIIDPDTELLQPMARPVCLKGDSIAVIRDFAPMAEFGPAMWDYREKRTIAHMRPPRSAVEQLDIPAPLRLVIFPRYQAGSATEIKAVPRAESFIRIAKSAFNYGTLGEAGFELVSRLLENCKCYELVYSDLDDVIDRIGRLLPARRAAEVCS
jgi:HprK-related kinase A